MKMKLIVGFVNVHAINSNAATESAFHVFGFVMVSDIQISFRFVLQNESINLILLFILGDNDCSLGEDEQNCKVRNCSDNEFR